MTIHAEPPLRVGDPEAHERTEAAARSVLDEDADVEQG